MSWLFSQALAVEFWPESCSDGELSAQSSGHPTQLAYLPPDKMTAFSRLSRFGMTFRPLTADRGEALLKSYLAAFRAKTSALPEKVPASQAIDQGCGDTWRGSLARFDPDTSSWKTVQHSLLEDSGSSSVTWPRSGMTAGGQCLELPMSGRRINATGSGLWQTPVADDAVNRVNGKINSRGEPKLSAQVLRRPTPVASDTSSRNKPYAQGGTPLSLAVKWPTPTVCGNYNRKGASATSGDGLATAVNRWPTPTARMHKGGGNSMTRKDGKSRSDMLDWAVEYQTGMRLNPTWVEWLMGWPLGWTDLKPLATDKCPPAPQQHGDC